MGRLLRAHPALSNGHGADRVGTSSTPWTPDWFWLIFLGTRDSKVRHAGRLVAASDLRRFAYQVLIFLITSALQDLTALLDRYWAFQGIETGIFVVLAAALIAVTAIVVLRRDA